MKSLWRNESKVVLDKINDVRGSDQTRRKMLSTVLATPLLGYSERPQIIAHRGEHLLHPENTIPAIEGSILAGADFVEIDVRTTKDGCFILMHDSTVDRTTNGKGRVTDFTLAELKKLEVQFPGFSGVQIPTLDEALEAASGKLKVYFDAKAIAAKSITEALQRHRISESTLVYGNFELLKSISQLGHPSICMPEAVSVEAVQRILKEINPRVIAFDWRDFQPEIIAVVKNAGKGIFVDRLGPQDTPEHWREAIQMGATGIQTDHPAQLKKMLNASPKEAAL